MRLVVFLAAVLVVCGCSREPESTSSGDERAPDSYKVRVDTRKGGFVMTVTRSWAPLGADRFYTLVKSGFYDGARFFRVLPGFVVQFGIPRDPGLNAKWRNAKLPDDRVRQSNRRGTVSFATSGPNTRTTQVFINLANNARLDGRGFAPFAAVTQGMEVVDQFYSGYGEGPPMGGGPSQSRAEAEGNVYFERAFPKLDYIKKAI
ncbi:MAG: peptidyl-prolyl cis-trans isomerase PpiA precursor [Bryobacterales bacterium]|nr:peptidyl-prolyl cis-trans isomerase PpiA precursor [Bryobacterales bacterium]